MPETTHVPRVTIIILNWNGKEDTLDCLHSLRRSSYSNFTTIVVDNGSTDGSVPAIRKAFPDLVVIENRDNSGFTGGNNIGIRHALENGAEYVWLLNNDTIIEPDTLAKLVAKAESSPDIALLSPVIHWYEDPDSIQFYLSYVDWGTFNIINFSQEEHDRYADRSKDYSLWGTALLIKRHILEKLGGLDDRFFAYAEDAEYCMRASREGYGIAVDPTSRIFHKNSRATGSNTAPLQCFLRIRNQYFLWRIYLRGWDRVSFLRKYLGDAMSLSGVLYQTNQAVSLDYCLDGVWCAFRNIPGPYNGRDKMPKVLKEFWMLFLKFHPFFWSHLIQGNYRRILRDIRVHFQIK
jgi:GT2 family glycosyltransferase